MLNGKILFVGILVVAVAIFVFYYVGRPSVPQSLQPATETDEQKIMRGIGPNATEEERQEYARLAKSLAREAESITIKDCKGSPVVLKAAAGKAVKVVNQDSNNHQLTLDSGNYKYQLAANSTTEVQFDFFRGNGFYSYGCDRTTGPAGVLFVE